MRNSLIFILLACGLVPAVLLPAKSSDDFTPRKAFELNAREGLPNVLAKLRRGGPVTIAYLGGSITAQAGWRVQSRAWLQARYPQASIREIHAAVGGTGSELGVFRLEGDVLTGNPDLIFVEFAVNDANVPPARIRRSMEGIVRKTWRVLPGTDICFVYTLTERDAAGLAAGRLKRSESVMEEVADHYGIPSVHLGFEIARMAAADRLVMRSSDALMTRVAGDELDEAAALARDADGRVIFSKDGVHPYSETGHVLYTQALVRSLEKLVCVVGARPHALSAPLVGDNWEQARRIAPGHPGVRFEGHRAKLDPATSAEARQFAARMPELWRLDPGSTLRFKFKGTKVSFYDLLGPEGAVLEVQVNGESRRHTRFDRYCVSTRLATLQAADSLPDAVHEVSVTVLAERPDKRALLSERHRGDWEKSPAKYEPARWYLGAIFLIGEVVDSGPPSPP